MIFSPHSFFIIIKNRGGHIRGHKEKLKCAKCSHLSILLFLGGMENNWRNHNACPKLLYACYGTSLGMVFDSEHAIFSHQSSNWHFMLLSTCYLFFFLIFFWNTQNLLNEIKPWVQISMAYNKNFLNKAKFTLWFSSDCVLHPVHLVYKHNNICNQNESNKEPKDMKIFHETCSWK